MRLWLGGDVHLGHETGAAPSAERRLAALRPLVDADIGSQRLVAPFEIELKPRSAYYLVCPEVIADRIAVAAFRKWLLEQAKENRGQSPISIK